MKKLLLTSYFLLLTSYFLKAQTFQYDFHGFVNPHYYADSRAVYGGREDMMLFYPKPVGNDAAGNDTNAGWQANMLAITARMGLRITGPDALGAKTTAYIEGDFTGATDATINTLRLRHAYIRLNWQRHHLLMGQYWYPMQIHEVMPLTNPLNMGAPFALYARYNQVRYDASIGRHLEVVAAASWQLDNKSQGELYGKPTASTAYARHSLVPELTAQVRYRNETVFFGGAVSLRTIQPQVPQTTVNERLHTSVSYTLFGKIRLGGVDIKAQTLLNNSLYEGCSLGGYVMLTNGDVEDWHFNTVWIDISKREGRWRPGIFMGYAENEDYGDLHGQVYGRGYQLEYLWRIQPRLLWKVSDNLSCTAEAEYTYAGYDKPVGNLRLSLSVQYDW